MKSLSTLYRIGNGPSSSHTIGPSNIAKYVINKYGQQKYIVELFGSLSLTGVGHGTDRVIKEILGPETEIIFNKTIQELKHPNTLKVYIIENGNKKEIVDALSIGGGATIINGVNIDGDQEVYKEKSFSEIKEVCKKNNWSLVDYVKNNESNVFNHLTKCWEVMKNSIQVGLNKEGYLPGQLHVERKAKRLYNSENKIETPSTKEQRIASSFALAVSEENADNGLIVTAPTCGSCGIIPGVFGYWHYLYNVSDERIIEALAVAGVIGNVIKTNASISGAECGCQAEVGSACAMAAAGMMHLGGANIDAIECAAEIALEHNLGLTCDPALGYVQIPCIERNAVGVSKVFEATILAYALFSQSKIRFDDIVSVMYKTGKDMSSNYRETSISGLAELYKNN